MMNQLLVVRLGGSVDTPELGVLRERLGLTPRGRLGDDWDANFGTLVIRPIDEEHVLLNLYRDLNGDGEWRFILTYEREPLPEAEVNEWERRIRDAAGAAGLTVTEVRRGS